MKSRRVPALALALLALLGLPASRAAAGDFKGGVRFGYYTDASEPFLGGELLVRLAPRFYFNPNVEVVLVENGSYLTFNGDFHYDFPTHSTATFWLGGGLALVQVNPEGPNNTDSSAAANFLAGVGFRTGSVIPYFQAKIIAKDSSEFVLAFGLRF